jgi:ADP-ribose pyrophosphatase YjhB (NUDIX family)
MKLRLNTIPENATCVFSGIQFRIWQWPQVEFDGNVATYEMAERVPTLWVIAVVGDKILIQNEIHAHKPDMPFYSLPGGKGEFDEDPLVGAKRELSEESGYESSDWELYAEESETGKIAWLQYIYIARNAQKTHDSHLDGGEKITSILCSLDEFFDYAERDDFRGYLVTEIITALRKDAVKKEEFIKLLFKK